jgi:hypothetical protein
MCYLETYYSLYVTESGDKEVFTRLYDVLVVGFMIIYCVLWPLWLLPVSLLFTIDVNREMDGALYGKVNWWRLGFWTWSLMAIIGRICSMYVEINQLIL